jgi:hypothetical protein
MKWKNGTPPEPGWYPTRFSRDTTQAWQNAYRWWDGRVWSWPAFPHENEFQAARWAAKKEVKSYKFEIIWGTT